MNKLQNLISELEKHHKKKLDLSLGRTFNLLKKLGNPQDKLNNIITVVGTNAKASMSYSLKAILNQAGLKCNMYTSPHLQSYTERFVFNDKKLCIFPSSKVPTSPRIERFVEDETSDTCCCCFFRSAFVLLPTIVDLKFIPSFDNFFFITTSSQ